ncbi:MAG: winged helix-turn-helix transcriptional regulator, partial [Micromonosporaceae bacterium]
MAEQAGGEPSAVTPPEASAPAGRPEAAAAPPMPQSALIQLRQQHERRVLAILQSQGPTSRAELARIMKLSRSTVSNLTGALLATGSLVEVEPAQETQRSRGRPVTLLALNPAAGQTAGIDFGHRRVYVVIANLAHQVVGAASRRHGEQTSWKRRAAIAVELLEALATQHDIA